jgi:hypothetical protein
VVVHSATIAAEGANDPRLVAVDDHGVADVI